MLESPSKKLLAVVGVAVFAVFAVVAGAGVTSTPGVHNGVVTGCVEPYTKGNQDTSGDLKLADCPKGAKTITWNISGPTGQSGPAGSQGGQGPAGPQGATGGGGGGTGPAGPAGPAGATGATGATGPAGPAGSGGSPLVYSFAGASGPDTGACSDSGSGAGWATDTFDATYVVAMQPDGSYVLTKVVKGTFVTIAGVSQPNPPTADCDTAASRQTGGVTGTFYGSMSVTVPANSGFNPFASCGAPCSPHTTVTSATSAQNDAFVAAFFRAGVGGTLTGYSFVYDAGANGHMEQDFIGTATGNITG